MAGLGRFPDTAARRRWSFFVWIGTCCFAAGGEERILLLTEYGLTASGGRSGTRDLDDFGPCWNNGGSGSDREYRRLAPAASIV